MSELKGLRFFFTCEVFDNATKKAVIDEGFNTDDPGYLARKLRILAEKLEKLKPDVIALPAAVLCENCQTISDASGEFCPKCDGKGALVSVAKLLNNKNEKEEVHGTAHH